MHIDLTVADLKTITTLLNSYLPGTTVWAFGSRVKFTSKPASDLDLVAFIQPEQESDLADLKEAFAESDLPFKVDILDWEVIPDNFKKNIEKDYVVLQDLVTSKRTIPKNWKAYQLKNITTKIGSGATPRGGKEVYLDKGEYSLIRSQNILDFSFSKNGLAFISAEQAKELQNVTVQENDVLINITGDSVARVCKVPNELIPARVNQHVAIIRVNENKADPDFLKYYLLEPSFKNHLSGLASAGATRNALTKTMIENLEVIAPNLATQQSISNILTSLDKKIELNLQMNQTLETIAQNIFKEWFVNFNFPGFDKELIGGVPRGWQITSIGRLISVQNGYAFKGGDFKEFGENGVIKIKNIFDNWIDINNVQFVEDNVAENIDLKFKVHSQDLLIAMIGAQSGKLGIIPNNSKSLWLNQRVGLFREKVKHAKWFCFLVLSSEEYQNKLLGAASGSAQPNISASQIESMETIIPNKNIIEDFGNLINPIFKKIIENYSENQVLIDIRDSLLPRLMTGKLKVSA